MRPAATAPPLSARGLVLLVLGHVLLAVLLTHPVALRLGRGELWGGGPDTYQSLWNLWWTKTALASDGERWLYSDWIFQPEGMPLALHTFAPLKCLLGIPLDGFLAPVDVHNLLMLATFWLAGVASFLLVYDWLGQVRWALLGSLVYAYSPFHSVHALGHLNLASLEFLPLFFLCLGRALGGTPEHLGAREPASRRVWSAGAGAAWALTFWVDLQYALFLGLMAPLFWLALRRAGRAPSTGERPRPAALALWFSVTAALLAAPLAVPMGAELLRSGMPAAASGSELYSLDLVAVALPSPFNPVSGRLLAPWVARFPAWYDSVERVGYVGLVPLLCGLLAFRGPLRARAWRWMLGAAWILSLGPTLRVLGFDTRVPLPSALFAHVPVLDQFRAPARFQVLTALALAVLVPAVLARFAERLRPARAAALASAACAFVALDLVAFPVVLAPVHVPGAVRYLAAQPGHDAVHLLALDETPYVWMYYQTLCEKKLLIGRAARLYPERERAAEDAQERLSAALRPDASGRFSDPAAVHRAFREAGVSFLVAPLGFVGKSPRLRQRYEEMRAHFFPEGPAFQDDEHAVFRIDSLP